jgi:hypothetical protein
MGAMPQLVRAIDAGPEIAPTDGVGDLLGRFRHGHVAIPSRPLPSSSSIRCGGTCVA